MNLDGLLSNSKVARDLLIEFTCHNQRQNANLLWRKAREALGEMVINLVYRT